MGANANATTPRSDDLNLDNLVPYTHPSAAWSDRHSNLSLVWENPTDSGLQRLQSDVGWGGPTVVERLLTWGVSEDGRMVRPQFQSRNFRPDKVIESDLVGQDLQLTITTSWPSRNALALEVELSNQTDKPRSVEMVFGYPGKGVPPNWTGPYPITTYEPFRVTGLPHCVSIDGEPEGSWSTLHVHLEHGRNSPWVQGYVVGVPGGAVFELVCLADLSPRKVELVPNGRAGFTVSMAFGKNRAEARAVSKGVANKISAGWTSAAETRRLQTLLNNAAPLPPKYQGQERYERMYAHAISGLNSLFIRGDGGYTGHRRLPYTTKGLLAMPFLWDSSWSSVGAREFDPSMAEEPIECFTENPTPRGSLPGTMCDTHRSGEGQAPIMAWAAWLVYQRSQNKDWLARVYPPLVGYHDFLFKYHASERSLVKWFRPDSFDDDARWDPVYGGFPYGQLLFGFESPDINAILVMKRKCLALMARELGHTAEAAKWEEGAKQLGQLIVDTMYFPEKAMFLDVKEGTRELFTGVKTPALFLPLWAGVPLPEAEIRRVIEEHMLNPNEFFRELPFPSLSYDDPAYDPRGYWRGRIWPHFVFWMIQILWHYGYKAEAELTADRLVKMYQRTAWHHENYESAHGEGWDNIRQMGYPEYNWAHATVIELLLERYKDPIL